MAKFISFENAAAQIPDGSTVMIGGVLGCGCPHKLINALVNQGTKNLTIITDDCVGNIGPSDDSYYSVAKLIHNHQVKKIITSYIGSNRDALEQMKSGELEVIFVPTGSLSEMIRANGAGLGGVLTPVGLGTVIENAEHTAGTITIDGKTYLIEKTLHADFALIDGYKVDRRGNIWYKGNSRNFNPLMATAADTVIVEAEHLVEVGTIEPENVMTPFIYVDYIANGGVVK